MSRDDGDRPSLVWAAIFAAFALLIFALVYFDKFKGMA